MKTHVITDGDGTEREFVLDGSTTCPRPEWCDRKSDGPLEEMNDYIVRHARDHEMDFPSQSNIEDVERNLTLHCGYFGHKYVIGNKTMTPFPFWETHEFVFNWVFSPDDLEMQMWDEPDPAAAEGYTFQLKPSDERLPGVYKRFKEVELPRGTQKTSTVCKAFVTIDHLRQRFIFDNIYHRIIITSATTTLTEGVTNALKAVWEKNRNIKRLFGINRYRQVMKRGQFVPVYLRRDGIYGSKTKNTLNLRWTKDADDASGLTSFAVLYAGIKTETQGQRADVQIFDDGSTKKNSKLQARREEVVECFEEQVNQLDPTGRFIACNTRQHINDFGGKMKTPEYRSRFHIMHRRSRFVDPATGIEKAYYPVDGLGRERYSLRVLDEMASLKPEHEMWSEYQNCPRNPKSAMFKRIEFQVVDDNDPRVPIEIKAGLGRDLNRDERAELERNRLHIRAYNTCDPASKEEITVKGDCHAIGGHRFDRNNNWWMTHIALLQCDSDELWNQIWLGWLKNRPMAVDYELPASEIHVQSSFEAWRANKAATMGFPISMIIDFDHMPKSGKPARIAGLVPWTKNMKFFILKSACDDATRAKFIQQYVDYPVTDHDDAPDMTSRCLRYVSVPSLEQVKAALAPKEGPRLTAEGALRVRGDYFLDSFKDELNRGVKNWGARGRRSA